MPSFGLVPLRLHQRLPSNTSYPRRHLPYSILACYSPVLLSFTNRSLVFFKTRFYKYLPSIPSTFLPIPCPHPVASFPDLSPLHRASDHHLLLSPFPCYSRFDFLVPFHLRHHCRDLFLIFQFSVSRLLPPPPRQSLRILTPHNILFIPRHPDFFTLRQKQYLFIPRHSDFFTLRQNQFILIYSFLGIQKFHFSAIFFYQFEVPIWVFSLFGKNYFTSLFEFFLPIWSSYLSVASYSTSPTFLYAPCVPVFVGIYDQSLPSSCTYFFV